MVCLFSILLTISQEPSATPTSTGQLSINTATPLGYYVGNLTKQGAFVKSWKVRSCSTISVTFQTRHFSLTWNYLSYYDPSSKALLGSVPLAQCQKVVEGQEKPWSFQLVSPERTYSFVSQAKVRVMQTTLTAGRDTEKNG